MKAMPGAWARRIKSNKNTFRKALRKEVCHKFQHYINFIKYSEFNRRFK